MNVLTPRRRAILKAMRNRRLSMRELASAVGLASGASLHTYHLVLLEKAGYIKRTFNCARTLRLTGKGLLAAQGYELIWTADADGIHKEVK